MVRLELSSVDDGYKTIDFQTKEHAVAYAVWWFLEGYSGVDQQSIEKDEILMGHAADLIKELTAGNEFHCGRFHENIKIVHVWR